MVKIISQPNGGVSSARNKGIENSIGEYILFMDPDDTVTEDYIATLSRELAGRDCDYLLFGFWQIQEHANGMSEPLAVLPRREYAVASTEDAVLQLLPNFIGRSLETITNWIQCGVFNPYEEFGSVWRCAYRREIMEHYRIRFRRDLFLIEDAMFNCDFISHIRTGRTCMKPLYVYTIRGSGAMSRKRGNALLTNTRALLNAREEICAEARSRGYDQISDRWYTASTVFSVFSALKTVDCSCWKELNGFVQHPAVRKAIRQAPISLRKPVYCVMILLLKLRLHWVLFLLYKICGKLNIKFNLVN